MLCKSDDNPFSFFANLKPDFSTEPNLSQFRLYLPDQELVNYFTLKVFLIYFQKTYIFYKKANRKFFKAAEILKSECTT